MTKELLDELLYLIELQIKANLALSLGHYSDVASKEAEAEMIQYHKVASLIDSLKDDLK